MKPISIPEGRAGGRVCVHAQSPEPVEGSGFAKNARLGHHFLMIQPEGGRDADVIVGCAAVNEHVNRPIPGRLWHYTSQRAFQGIITSKKIWATEYRFLSDREELLHAKELAQKLADEAPEFIGEQFPAREYARKAVEIVFKTGYLQEERHHLMVASFSEEGDQLSQWRGYADDSRGVSIGFDLRNIRPPAELGSAMTFAPCLYKQVDKVALLSAIFVHHRTGLQEWWESVVDAARRMRSGGAPIEPNFGRKLVAERQEELKRVVARSHTTLKFDLLRAAPLLKNESFSEEKEWRLVLPLRGIPKAQPLEFRPIRDAIIPYVAYPLRRAGEEGPAPCTDVILGPGCHTSAAMGTDLFLRTQEIMVLSRRSQIPYRPT